MDQADAYISALNQGERYSVAGDRLEILDGEGAVRLVLVRDTPLQGEPVDLVGTAWRILTEDEKDDQVGAATMAFLNERLIVGATACRDYLATYGRSEATLNIQSTSMLRSVQPCPEPFRMLEAEYTDFLSWTREYSVYEEQGARLLSIKSDRGETLTFETLSPIFEDVAGAEWTLETFVELRQGGGVPRDTAVAEGTEVTVLFDNGSISGEAGCNSYSVPVKVEGRSIAIEVQSFQHTERACEGPNGVMEQEKKYLDLLPRLARYGIYGDSLFLQTDGDVFLLFQAR